MLSEESASSACPPLRTLPEDLVESGSIRVLRLLVRLMRDPVLQRSADALGVSAPTASRLLARARQWFKDPLFIYSAGRMHPTPRMLALSPRIEEELLRLESLFKPEEPFNPATVVRTLRIAAIDNAFHTLLMPFLETAATAAPGLSISVFDRAPTLLEDMRAGTLDLAFYSTEGRPVPSDFCEETLFTSGHVLLMRRGHPLHQKWLADGGRQRPSDHVPSSRTRSGTHGLRNAVFCGRGNACGPYGYADADSAGNRCRTLPYAPACDDADGSRYPHSLDPMSLPSPSGRP